MKTIIISRTDSIGDVMLTLPLCVWLRNQFKDAKLIFLGKNYTKQVVDCFEPIDQFVDWNEIENKPVAESIEFISSFQADAIIHVFPNKEIASLAKKAKIPVRIGTSHRGFHLFTCTHRLNFTRKKSELHEAQLNFHLLKPFGLENIPSIDDVIEMTDAFKHVNTSLPSEIEQTLSNSEKSIILHPKSQGSAVEWPMESYVGLATHLVERGYTVFFTGTESEGHLFRSQLPKHPFISDVTGKLTLAQLISFISRVKNLVACSTGPLHIAGFCGIRTIGLFSPKKPIHPGRWKPLGKNVVTLVYDANCMNCSKGKPCNCIQNISVERVFNEIQ
jgi:heptosyltransferase-3